MKASKKSENAIIERCAKECERIAWSHKNTQYLGPELHSQACAEAIRALKHGTLT